MGKVFYFLDLKMAVSIDSTAFAALFGMNLACS